MTSFSVFVVSGDAPSGMYSVRFPGVFPCVSKRAVCRATHGVLFASSAGMVLVTGAGAENITTNIIDHNAWQEIVPANTHAVFFNGKLFAFNSTSGVRFVLDFETQSYTTLSSVYSASHISPVDGLLYVAEAINGVYSVREWEGDRDNLMQYTWQSKEFRHPLATWRAARLRVDNNFYQEYLDNLAAENTLKTLNEAMIAAGTVKGAMGDEAMGLLPLCGSSLYSIDSLSIDDEITFQVWVDGVKRCEAMITDDTPIKLPGRYAGRRTQIKIFGYLPIAPSIEVATSMGELVNAPA